MPLASQLAAWLAGGLPACMHACSLFTPVFRCLPTHPRTRPPTHLFLTGCGFFINTFLFLFDHFRCNRVPLVWLLTTGAHVCNAI